MKEGSCAGEFVKILEELEECELTFFIARVSRLIIIIIAATLVCSVHSDASLWGNDE